MIEPPTSPGTMNCPELPRLLVEDAVRAALKEDLGRAGDITSLALISAHTTARLAIAARQEGTLAGLALAEAAFHALNDKIVFRAGMADGQALKPGSVVAHVGGRARDILAAERVALNFLAHLSGIATLTNRLAQKIAHTGAKITSTRKTTPGLRAFEKYAVRCGGGANHRYGLDDAILIKDNHIAIAGGVAGAIKAAQRYCGHMVKIEIEIDTLAQLEAALAHAPDAILLDNMDTATLRQAVCIIRQKSPKISIEASGGITLDNAAEKAETGVDYLSSGFITQSAPALDLGLDTGF